MTAISAETQKKLTEISGLIEKNLVQDASSSLSALIKTLSREEFLLVSPDIKAQI